MLFYVVKVHGLFVPRVVCDEGERVYGPTADASEALAACLDLRAGRQPRAPRGGTREARQLVLE